MQAIDELEIAIINKDGDSIQKALDTIDIDAMEIEQKKRVFALLKEADKVVRELKIDLSKAMQKNRQIKEFITVK